jgi:hypothetical protein
LDLLLQVIDAFVRGRDLIHRIGGMVEAQCIPADTRLDVIGTALFALLVELRRPPRIRAGVNRTMARMSFAEVSLGCRSMCTKL